LARDLISGFYASGRLPRLDVSFAKSSLRVEKTSVMKRMMREKREIGLNIVNPI